MKIERKVIFECRTGSHLFGTMTPMSDEDYMGVFLPSSADMFGLTPCPTEWDLSVKKSTGDKNTKGDIDRKFYSLQQFFTLALEGQSNQTEMLFAPSQAIIASSPEWENICKHRDLLVSSRSLSSMIGFCVAQSIKACSKGDNLNQIRTLITVLSKFESTVKIASAMALDETVAKNLGQTTNKEGANLVVVVAGKRWDLNASVKRIITDLRKMEAQYGERSKNTAEKGFDFRSLSHAYRLVGEAREYITTGFLTLPRPKAEVDLILAIKRGEYITDYFAEIEANLAEIRGIPLHKSINQEPDKIKIEELCNQILYTHLLGLKE